LLWEGFELSDTKKIQVDVAINLSNIDEYLAKANKYVELLAEAKTLAEELASAKFEIEVSGHQA